VPPAGQKAVVVDHHTRSLRVDGTPWQGSGWYIFSGWLCDGHANAPPFDWAPGTGAGSFIDQINQLASAGFKQFVVYDINKIICGGAVNETLVPVLDSFAAVGARVLLDVRDEIAAVMAANSSADTGGAAWADLKAVVAEVRNHDAVLAYYTCDDCCRWAVNTPGGNAPFALQLAQVRILQSIRMINSILTRF